MKEILLKNYAFNLRYANDLVADVDEELMVKSGGDGLENHPAFTLGHLITAAALTSRYLGGPYTLNEEWEQLFRRTGPGDPRRPEKDKALYPGKAELLEELAKQHALVEELIRKTDDQKLKKTTQWRFHEDMPTLGDLLHFMCISHESMHLGQLAAWRRAMGLPSSLGRI